MLNLNLVHTKGYIQGFASVKASPSLDSINTVWYAAIVALKPLKNEAVSPQEALEAADILLNAANYWFNADTDQVMGVIRKGSREGGRESSRTAESLRLWIGEMSSKAGNVRRIAGEIRAAVTANNSRAIQDRLKAGWEQLAQAYGALRSVTSLREQLIKERTGAQDMRSGQVIEKLRLAEKLASAGVSTAQERRKFDNAIYALWQAVGLLQPQEQITRKILDDLIAQLSGEAPFSFFTPIRNLVRSIQKEGLR